MSDKRIPMVAEVLPVEPQKQKPQSSYGTGTPKRAKKTHTVGHVGLELCGNGVGKEGVVHKGHKSCVAAA